MQGFFVIFASSILRSQATTERYVSGWISQPTVRRPRCELGDFHSRLWPAGATSQSRSRAISLRYVQSGGHPSRGCRSANSAPFVRCTAWADGYSGAYPERSVLEAGLKRGAGVMPIPVTHPALTSSQQPSTAARRLEHQGWPQRGPCAPAFAPSRSASAALGLPCPFPALPRRSCGA